MRYRINLNSKKRNIILVLLMSMFFVTRAQKTPVIIQGATVHIGNGKVLENAHVAFADGKITLVTDQAAPFYKNATIIDGKGKHVYPGLICLNTLLGLNEIDAVRATRDYVEVGYINPNVRTLVAYNTDSKIIPTYRYNGILLTQVIPQGGLISGTSSIMKTSGWNWEDAVLKTDDGVHINWPEPYGSWENAEKRKERISNEQTLLDEFFKQAAQYSRTEKPEVINLRLESMKGIFQGNKKCYVHVNTAKGIIQALNFFKQYPSVQMVLVGADESYQAIDQIKEQNVPVVLNIMHRLPGFNQEDVDMPYKLPSLLMKSGILVAIGHYGSWEPRNLMYNAGTAAAYGLSKEEALSCITLNAARITGTDDRVGSLELNKDATLIITEGDVLDMKSSKVEKAFINGEEVSLEGIQQQLYQKYMNKYGLK